MTDQEKLQKLFDAALRDSTPLEKPPTRAVPKPSVAPTVSQETTSDAPATTAPVKEPTVEQPLFDKAAAEELGVLLDEQMLRKKRRHRVESRVAAIVLIGISAGSAGWFVQSPERVQAFLSVVAEIRSVGDVKAIVAKYDAALKRISERGRQIDSATTAMGVVNKDIGNEDPYFDAEMKQMMGGEGKTSGDRAKRMQQAFGKVQQEHGATAGHFAAVAEDANTIE